MKFIGTLFLISLIFFLFQNCSNVYNFSNNSTSNSASSSLGNGDGYGGKPTSYEYRDPNHACTVLGANQIPLANRQIFLFSDGKKQLVRDQCTDINPIALGNEAVLDATGTFIIFNQQNFIRNTNPDDFAIVAAGCPAGRTLLASPNRVNKLSDSQFLNAPAWGGPSIPDLNVQIDGSLAGIPAYRIERNNPSMLQNYRRPAQNPPQQTNVDYAFSFLAKPSATEKAFFISDTFGFQDLEIEFDLLTGAANVVMSSGAANISTSVQNINGALFITIFFRSTVNANPHIGVSSLAEVLGSAVTLTAFQFEEVNNYCSP